MTKAPLSSPDEQQLRRLLDFARTQETARGAFDGAPEVGAFVFAGGVLQAGRKDGGTITVSVDADRRHMAIEAVDPRGGSVRCVLPLPDEPGPGDAMQALVEAQRLRKAEHDRHRAKERQVELAGIRARRRQREAGRKE